VLVTPYHPAARSIRAATACDAVGVKTLNECLRPLGSQTDAETIDQVGFVAYVPTRPAAACAGGAQLVGFGEHCQRGSQGSGYARTTLTYRANHVRLAFQLEHLLSKRICSMGLLQPRWHTCWARPVHVLLVSCATCSSSSLLMSLLYAAAIS
jgi:hypothetical protein